MLLVAFSVPLAAQQEYIDELRVRAEAGDAEAQLILGSMYAGGIGVLEDDAEAVRWFRLAAEQGDAEAQVSLGSMYAGNDEDVPRDDAEAFHWFRLAAEQGHVQAQLILGVMYDNGEGVLEDDAEAVRWFRLAADQGHAGAQSNLGVMYATGTGVPQDYLTAHMWFNLAASRSTGEDRDRAVQNRDRAAEELTADQRAEAQRLTREWAPRVSAEPGDSSPRIEDADPSEFRGATGTAFVVDPSGVLLTAQHVIDQATSIRVSCNGGPTVPVTVASSSPTIDLAVLTTTADLGTAAFLEVAVGQQPRLGDNVFTIGYPTPGLLGRDPKYTNGTISALSGPGGDASFLQISVPIQPGNSGGPLVNENGEVIGVVIATADAPTFIEATDSIPQNINWAVKSVFASALFTPPTQGASSTVDPDDVIDHVTAATCLVEAPGPARQ